MTALWVNDNNVVRETNKLWINDNGTVREVSKLFALMGSTSRLVYQAGVPVVVDIEYVTTSNSSWTPSTTTDYDDAVVYAIGGGGGAGSGRGDGGREKSASGGAAGGCAIRTLSRAQLQAGGSITIGPGGTATTVNFDGGRAGTNGGATTFSIAGFTMTANGGQKGVGNTQNQTVAEGASTTVLTWGQSEGATGGTASGGEFNYQGGGSRSLDYNNSAGFTDAFTGWSRDQAAASAGGSVNLTGQSVLSLRGPASGTGIGTSPVASITPNYPTTPTGINDYLAPTFRGGAGVFFATPGGIGGSFGAGGGGASSSGNCTGGDGASGVVMVVYIGRTPEYIPISATYTLQDLAYLATPSINTNASSNSNYSVDNHNIVLYASRTIITGYVQSDDSQNVDMEVFALSPNRRLKVDLIRNTGNAFQDGRGYVYPGTTGVGNEMFRSSSVTEGTLSDWGTNHETAWEGSSGSTGYAWGSSLWPVRLIIDEDIAFVNTNHASGRGWHFTTVNQYHNVPELWFDIMFNEGSQG